MGSYYYITIGWDVLDYLGINMKFSEHLVECGVIPYQSCTASTMDINKYNLLLVIEDDSEYIK